MTSTVIHQLKRILQDTESLEVSLREMHLSQEARTELDTIADKFRALAIMIGKKTQSFKPRQEDISWEKSKSRREKAEKTLTDILTRNKLSDRRVLRKNLITIFCGPDKHMHDSPTITSKKVATGKRCEKLRQLSSDGIIAWAIAYPSASWAGGVMGNDVFDCLLGDIEPNDTLQWPPEVNEMLLELQEKSIQDNEAFNKLVEDLSNPSRYDPRPDDAIALHPIDQPPNQRNRETKDMFSDAPFALVEQLLPRPFRGWVKNSEQWKWERSQGYSTTSCLNTLFPRCEGDDVSVTIWIGHNDGYRLNDMFGVTRSFSSYTSQ